MERPIDLIIAANTETGVTWLHSYITDDSRRVYCLYEAPNPRGFGIRPDWQVFVAAGEAVVRGDPVAGIFMGAARYTVNNVAPGSDVVVVRVTIESGSPLSIITDYPWFPHSKAG